MFGDLGFKGRRFRRRFRRPTHVVQRSGYWPAQPYTPLNQMIVDSRGNMVAIVKSVVRLARGYSVRTLPLTHPVRPAVPMPLPAAGQVQGIDRLDQFTTSSTRDVPWASGERPSPF
jgi:hypothetical protein